MRRNRISGIRNYDNSPLTNEQIQGVAPSAFAGQAYHKQSDRYAFIPTTEVIDTLREAGYLPMQASQSRSRIEGKSEFTKHMIRFGAANDSLSVVGDSRLEAVLINSHDGSSAYKLSLGVFRMVCSNGLVVSDSLVESISVRHTGNIVEQVLNGTRKMFENIEVVRETIARWSQIQLTDGEQLAFARAVHTMRFEQGAPSVEPERLLEVNRGQDHGNSLWKVTNRLQENTVRGGQRFRVTNEQTGRSRRASTRQVTGIDQDTKLNKAIWQLAQELENLKK